MHGNSTGFARRLRQKGAHKLLILNSNKGGSICIDYFTYCEVSLVSAYRYA
jgi:hypothetical protein